MNTYSTSTDDELIEMYDDAVGKAMTAAIKRDGIASNVSAESIAAGLRAVADAALAEEREKVAQIADRERDNWISTDRVRSAAARIAARIREQGKEQGRG